jgi:replicative DNA helicase
MDPSAVVLNKLLQSPDMEVYSKLKLAFLDPAYSSVYSAIERHYQKFGDLPNFESLELSNRETNLEKLLSALRLLETEEIDLDVAFEALVDHYTQNLIVGELDKYVDKIPQLDSAELKSNLAAILIKIDEKTLSTEGVYAMDEISTFERPEEILADRVFMGLNNTFDAALMGAARQEYILIGGTRGSGKSIASSNILINQYEQGNCAVLFTIEMSAKEVNHRNIAILAGVNHGNVVKGNLTTEEMLKVVKARANMFVGADYLVQEFIKNRDPYLFEAALMKNCKLKADNQIVIIDDRALTTTSIDLHLGKLKNKFGDKLTTCVVDYVNQVHIEGTNVMNKLDWQPQIAVSARLKELARKHDVLMVSPYQIDASGEARMAKGILDSADVALVLKAHEKEAGSITFSTTKMRGAREMSFTSGIDWDTLKISPQDVQPPADKTEGEGKKTRKVMGNAAAKAAEPAQEHGLF